MSTSYELLYFPLRGRAEPIRLMFATANVDFTNTPVTNWPELKPKTPLGQVPVLIERSESGERQLPQSMAIVRHLARVFNLDGKDEVEKTNTDVAAETINDWRTKFAPVQFAAFMHTEQAVIDKYWADLPGTLRTLEGLLGSCTWFGGGESPTYADVLAFDALDNHVGMKPESLADFPRLRALHDRFRALPSVAAYLAKRG
ncbi:glutathione S-transferase family protein [Polyangium sp. y55x31]|uniref:glutathione S-transferase family protein n=1 Tax=Polyangium sp. y55x31 TaxID=3042688 RepID=UPI002482FDDF|nr:glutathione S-transferase family protein [Polyangium sp. y55x31]MDI1483426.1 glutathione S-transferase family protein [Polyangium sp. y55x31]